MQKLLACGTFLFLLSSQPLSAEKMSDETGLGEKSFIALKQFEKLHFFFNHMNKVCKGGEWRCEKLSQKVFDVIFLAELRPENENIKSALENFQKGEYSPDDINTINKASIAYSEALLQNSSCMNVADESTVNDLGINFFHVLEKIQQIGKSEGWSPEKIEAEKKFFTQRVQDFLKNRTTK